MTRSSRAWRSAWFTAAAIAFLAGVVAIFTGPSSAGSSSAGSGRRPTIVLLHGAWADASSWSKVSERLQRDGFEVRVPPNNLRGVATDAPDVAHYLETIDGPIVLAAHSYGGFVATNAARGNPNVKALVYVDAFIPDEGETLVDLNQPPGIFATDPSEVFDLVPFSGAPAGQADAYVKASVYGEAFADRGLSGDEIEVLAAGQRPLATPAFGQPSGSPAWATIPSWAVIGTQDRIIPEAAQRRMADRAGSRITVLDAPHLSMLTDARAIARVIVKAARST
jgi:pimeloyl-ACP methyl ester carboxylesterase